MGEFEISFVDDVTTTACVFSKVNQSCLFFVVCIV